jgi:hypothetical protein
MLSTKPLLLLGYNRPEKTVRLINELRPLRPSTILFSVDGPKVGNDTDEFKVKEVQRAVGLIDWKCDIDTRFRTENLGLRKAVVDSVNWAIDRFGCVTVIEDDALPGPELVKYSEFMLDRYEFDTDIAHVNNYNIAPTHCLSNHLAQNRASIYPSSYAWSTWERSWRHFDQDLEWGINVSIKELAHITGSLVGALKWKLNFFDAKAERIDTWAYRWISSMWSKNFKTVGPNVNISLYSGWNDGTHTRSRPTWSEIPISNLKWDDLLNEENQLSPDQTADKWLSENVYGETIKGLTKGILASVALQLIQMNRR